MTINEVFKIAAETGDFPYVETKEKSKYQVNNIGQIAEIRKRGVSVNFGGLYNIWFHAETEKDGRKRYMSELIPTNKK